MKQFWGKKPLDTILKDAKFKGFSIDTTDYDNHRDYIFLVKKHHGEVLNIAYNTFNWNFGGNYWEIEFSNLVDTFDDETRMNELFDLFYLPPKNNENN